MFDVNFYRSMFKTTPYSQSAQFLSILRHMSAKVSDKFYSEYYEKGWRMHKQCVPGPFSSPLKGPGDEATAPCACAVILVGVAQSSIVRLHE